MKNKMTLKGAVFVWLIGTMGFAGLAHAVNVNHGGYGQVLIYPYYTVNDGNTTLMSVVNDSEFAKAVKVRVLEGTNALNVLHLNVYLAAKDVWTASLKRVNGSLTLETSDNSCTVPYLYSDGGMQPLPPWGATDEPLYQGYDPAIYEDMSRTREGHIEVIVMGDMQEGSASEGYITHVDGEPAGCDEIIRAWTWPDDTDPSTRGYWLQNPTVDLLPFPSGGLFGGASIVNARQGSLYSYNAIAINGYANSILANDLLHTEPAFTTPNLNSGDSYEGYVFLDNGASTSSGFYRGVDAVSYVLMHESIANEYIVDDIAGAATEWVVTFPTMAHYVYPDISQSDEALAPFTRLWNDSDACEVVLLKATRGGSPPWRNNFPKPKDPDNRTESSSPPGMTDPVPLELCHASNVIAFGRNGGDVLASNNLIRIDNDPDFLTPGYGWARLELDDYSWDENGDGVVDCDENGIGSECNSRDPIGNLQGLPVVGFGIQRLPNGSGGTFRFRTTRKLGGD